MPAFPDHVPARFAAELAELPPIQQTQEWRDNRKLLIGAQCLVEYISWPKPGICPAILETVAQKDTLAQREAENTGALRIYVPGSADPTAPLKPFRNWCGWDTHADARAAIHRPDHMDAADYALEEDIYRYVYLRVSDLHVSADPQEPEIIKPLRAMTLPQLLAHRAFKATAAS